MLTAAFAVIERHFERVKSDAEFACMRHAR